MFCSILKFKMNGCQKTLAKEKDTVGLTRRLGIEQGLAKFVSPFCDATGSFISSSRI